MKTKRERKSVHKYQALAERGSALIYVLIAVALFAALGFTLSRQSDSNETASLSQEQAELKASQVISYAAQARSALDQMLFTASTSIDQLDFTQPSDAAFDTGTLIHKIYHPQGGGLNPGTLDAAVINEVTSDPTPGWYMGRFVKVEWTAGPGEEVILTAYQITEQMCGILNEKATGSSAIPTATVALRNILIDDTLHGGTNVELSTDPGDICPDCENVASLCIQNGGVYAFYSILEDQ